MGRIRARLSFASVALVVLLAVGAGGFAFAQRPARNSGVIRACSAKKTGALRLLKRGRCRHGETAVSWSKQGPRGLQGAIGAPGATGARGAAGTNGSNGTNGANAATTVTRVEGSGPTIAHGATGTDEADCPAGTKAVGGGGSIITSGGNAVLQESFPLVAGGVPVGWVVKYRNDESTNDTQVEAQALCASP